MVLRYNTNKMMMPEKEVSFVMDTKTLRYFCACYETGSLNKASERFYISPQGMGKNINRLEEELGVMLPPEAETIFTSTARKCFTVCRIWK